MSDPDQIRLRDASIKLGQFLKLADLVDSGSDAKMAIAEGEVLVDGAVETRRGRQLHDGAVVEYAGRRARVVHGSGEVDVPW